MIWTKKETDEKFKPIERAIRQHQGQRTAEFNGFVGDKLVMSAWAVDEEDIEASREVAWDVFEIAKIRSQRMVGEYEVALLITFEDGEIIDSRKLA